MGAISHLVRVLTGKKQELAVGYEQIGNSESEEVYMELDLQSTRPGQYIIEIEVTDLNSGLTSNRERDSTFSEQTRPHPSPRR